eukprot:Nk52_evm56s223 gene=Nk52_evmTU56s223
MDQFAAKELARVGFDYDPPGKGKERKEGSESEVLMLGIESRGGTSSSLGENDFLKNVSGAGSSVGSAEFAVQAKEMYERFEKWNGVQKLQFMAGLQTRVNKENKEKWRAFRSGGSSTTAKVLGDSGEGAGSEMPTESFASWQEIQERKHECFSYGLYLGLDFKLLCETLWESLPAVDFISSLPEEIAVKVFTFVSPKDTCRLAGVSKTWHKIANDSSLWKTFYFREFANVALSSEEETYRSSAKFLRKIYRENEAAGIEEEYLSIPQGNLFRLENFPSNAEVPPHDCLGIVKNQNIGNYLYYWKRAYAMQHLLLQNWKQNKYEVHNLGGHSLGVYCLQFSNEYNMLITGSKDRAVRVWDLKRMKCRRILNGHLGSVLCLQFLDHVLITGSSDASIRVWNSISGTCFHVLKEHGDSVLNLQFDAKDGTIVSCSKDHSIKVFKLRKISENRKRSDEGPSRQSNAWESEEGDIPLSNAEEIRENMSDEDTGSIEHMDIDFKKKNYNMLMEEHLNDIFPYQPRLCEKTLHIMHNRDEYEYYEHMCLRGHESAVNVVQFDSKYIVSASGDRKIRVWDRATGSCLRSLEGHSRGIACLQFRGNVIVSGSSDKSIRIWDLEAGKCVRELHGHSQLVRCLHFDNHFSKLITGSYDTKIRVWNMAYSVYSEIQIPEKVFKVQSDGRRVICGAQDNILRVFDYTPNCKLNNLSIVKDILEKTETIPDHLLPAFEIRRRQQNVAKVRAYENAEDLSGHREDGVMNFSNIEFPPLTEKATIYRPSSVTETTSGASPANHVYENCSSFLGNPQGRPFENFKEPQASVGMMEQQFSPPKNIPVKRHLSSNSDRAHGTDEFNGGFVGGAGSESSGAHNGAQGANARVRNEGASSSLQSMNQGGNSSGKRGRMQE